MVWILVSRVTASYTSRGTTIADMLRPAKCAYAIGILGISAACGPVMGLLVGGFTAQAKG